MSGVCPVPPVKSKNAYAGTASVEPDPSFRCEQATEVTTVTPDSTETTRCCPQETSASGIIWRGLWEKDVQYKENDYVTHERGG